MSRFRRLFRLLNPGIAKQPHRGFQLRIEQLEDRCMLDGDPLDPIVIPPGDNLPDMPFADMSGLITSLEGDAPPMVTDEGDFYWHFNEQIGLLRGLDKFVIGLTEEANTNDVMAALTGEGGTLEGYVLTTTFGPDRFVLSRPLTVEFSPIDLGNVEETIGVEWVAPTFIGEGSGAPVYLTQEIAVALAPGVDPNTFFGIEYSGWRRLVNNQYIATIAAGGGLEALSLANQLTANPEVEWAAPNFDTEFRTAAIPNDPQFGAQWHLNNTGQTGARIGADADVAQAWDVTTGNSNIVIAILDNGVQLDHPDLNIFVNTGEIAGNGIDDDGNGFVDDVNGWDFVGDDLNQPLGAVPDNDPSPFTDADNHGTGVAGIAGAIGNNGVGVSGVIHNASILPIKIARDPGDGTGFVGFAQLASAVYYAAGAVLDSNNMITGSWRGADILVNSWGGGSPSPVLTAAFDWAATYGRDGRGVISFNATGNRAGGTVPLLNYQVTQVPVTPGLKQYVWSFQTNGDMIFAGENRAWITDIILPNGAQELLDVDNTLTGWQSPGAQPWTIADDPTHGYGTARFVARAGVLTAPNQQSNLVSPVITVTSNSTLQFARYVSSQLQFDQFGNPISDSLVLFESTNGGDFIPVWGNAGNPFPFRDVDYPANIGSTIAVGASTDWDYRSHYSQYGEALDIVAPSGGGYAFITTTDRTGADGYNSGSDYTNAFNGTSAATPLAAGIGALLLSRNYDLTTADIRAILRNTADKIGGDNGLTAYDTNGFNQFYGFGRVNALAAVEAVPVASGDYNLDGIVDAADYTVWRNSLGATVTPYTGADGDGNGLIEAADYQVWKSHFGQTIAMPLPASLAMAPRGSMDTGAYAATTTKGNGFAGLLPPQMPSSRSLHAVLRAGGEASIQPTLPSASDLALLALLDEPEHKRTSQVEFTLAIDNDSEDDKALVAELALDAIFSGP